MTDPRRCSSCGESYDAISRFCSRCGAAIVEADPLLGSVMAGRFRIERLIGEGGMGRVYEASQELGGVERKVAVKVLLPEFAVREADRQRFLRECATVAELEHPNTIKFYDAGRNESGELFIAMELLTGEPLSNLVAHGPLPVERVTRIVSQLCGSLEEAHGRGILHRDLKPENVFVGSQAGVPDFVKVIDFGIAKRLGDRAEKLTPLGVVLGSPPYMSPEQFTVDELDARSDIYSVGVIAYLLLSGRLPLEADSPFAWARAHLVERPIPLVDPAIPRAIREAVMRCLAKEKSERPPTVRALWRLWTGEAPTFDDETELAPPFVARPLAPLAERRARAAKGTLLMDDPSLASAARALAEPAADGSTSKPAVASHPASGPSIGGPVPAPSLLIQPQTPRSEPQPKERRDVARADSAVDSSPPAVRAPAFAPIEPHAIEREPVPRTIRDPGPWSPEPSAPATTTTRRWIVAVVVVAVVAIAAASVWFFSRA